MDDNQRHFDPYGTKQTRETVIFYPSVFPAGNLNSLFVFPGYWWVHGSCVRQTNGGLLFVKDNIINSLVNEPNEHYNLPPASQKSNPKNLHDLSPSLG